MSAAPRLRRSLVRHARRAAAIVFATSLLGAAGCGHNDATAPANIDGTYTLDAVDGVPAPTPIAANPDSVSEVTSGTLTIAGATFSLALRVKAFGQPIDGSSTGALARSGETLGFSGTFNGQPATLQGRVVSTSPKQVELTAFVGAGTRLLHFTAH